MPCCLTANYETKQRAKLFDCLHSMQSAHAGVHVVMVGAFEQEGEYNFTSQITISQTQIDWLIRDLKTVNRLVTPWVIAMIHTISL